MGRVYIIVIAAVIVISFIRLYIMSKKRHFVCPDCGNSFQVGFWKLSLRAHIFFVESQVTCPKCGATYYMKAIR